MHWYVWLGSIDVYLIREKMHEFKFYHQKRVDFKNQFETVDEIDICLFKLKLWN